MTLKRTTGSLEAFSLSLAIIAPTVGMSFTTPLVARAAGRALPLTFLVGGSAMLLVALSFVAFSRRITKAGSVTAFVGSVFGRRWGFLAGWTLLLTYCTYAAGSMAQVGIFAAAGLRHAGVRGVSLWPVIAITSGATAFVLAGRPLVGLARLLLVLEAMALFAIGALAYVILSRSTFSFAPFRPDPALGWSGVGQGTVFALLSFAGFEGATTLAEEVRRPSRTIPLAMIGAVVVATVLFVVVGYAQVLGFGLDRVGALAASDAPLDTLSTQFLFGGFGASLDFAAAVSALACAIGSITAAARLLYALGGSGSGERLGNVDPRRGVPSFARVVAGGLSLLLRSRADGWHPGTYSHLRGGEYRTGKRSVG